MFEFNLRLDNIGEGSSFIHRIHPCVKMIIAILAIAANGIISSVYMSLVLSIVFFILIMLSGLNFKTFMKAYALILLTVFGVILSYILIIGLTLENSITIWLNLTAFGLPVIFLMFTSPILKTLYGIEMLLNPLKKIKLPVNAIVLICTITLSFIPIVITEMQRILSSMAVRGSDIRFAKWSEKVKIFTRALIPLLISTLRSTETLASSIAVKNYDAWEPRTNVLHEAWKLTDSLFLIITPVTTYGLFVLISHLLGNY